MFAKHAGARLFLCVEAARAERLFGEISNSQVMSTHEPTLIPAASLPPVDACAARATILLVEDDRSIRRYLEVILQRAGYSVIVAADGLEAMKAALSSNVDAVVTDAIMPHLNGYELCRFLRRHPKLGQIPLILLSGVDQPAQQQSPNGSEQADVYLSKPVRPEELTGCIARLLVRQAA